MRRPRTRCDLGKTDLKSALATSQTVANPRQRLRQVVRELHRQPHVYDQLSALPRNLFAFGSHGEQVLSTALPTLIRLTERTKQESLSRPA